ncbi:putative ankyrin repeat protein [Lachnellula hyalina]|uniref:Putative ankyrin repeat protein n=1 Tax=Lachnellula hyalina TaxID=1316788 RepID=A0A8H8U0U7_9HELO|nr:putative ankyrin repeat protein [Lachnellula hyalina]TVY27700.1 putative ankyrin repeat protein [Lachnellula hyalina]
MSFGFSVGDFIKTVELANKVRKGFVGAPSQFNAISDEVRSLSIVLLDVEVFLYNRELRNEQEADLRRIVDGCGNVLNQLEHTLDNYGELRSGHRSASKTVKRMWKRLKWEPEDIKQLRDRIGTNIGLLNAFFTSGLIRDNVVTLVRSQEDQGRQTILDWITSIDHAAQQSNFLSRRQPGTGQWLLVSAEFTAWVGTSKRTLFCPGIPGAGKTVLTSIVIEELFTRFENVGNIGIAYLYCNYQRQHQQKFEDLIASLLKQLVQEQPSLPDSVKTLYNRHKDKRTRPSLDEILGVLQSVASVYSRVFIIVDAIDECQISDGHQQRLLSGLFELQAKCNANIFATSRHISCIEREFEGCLKLAIRASEEDVRKYLDAHMVQLPRFVARSLELQEKIKTDIVNAIDGMFLLAQLHLDSLTGKRSLKAVQTALKNLVKGSAAYDHAYKDAMERINGQIKDQEELAKQVLSWITCAKRPLAAIELQHALGVEVGESQLDEANIPEIEDMVSVCAGLVTIDEGSGIIRLVHYTAQEYFDRTQRQWFPDVQANIITTCVTYLSFDDFERGICQSDNEFEQRLQSNKFYDYAAHNWGHHAREASTSCDNVMDFLRKQAHVEASSQVLMASKRYSDETKYSQKGPKQMTGLHLAAFFGVGNVVLGLLNGNHPDLKDSHSRTPLLWAAERGHENVVKLLLDQGVGLDLMDSECGRTPLSWAAKNVHHVVVQLLLEAGADPNARGEGYGESALHLAAGIGNKAMVYQLLKAGADVNTRVGNLRSNESALHRAAARGHDEVVGLLLKFKADVRAKDYFGWTALHRAANAGYEKVVKLLLEADVAVVVDKNECEATALHLAALGGNKAIVEQLIEGNADVEARCQDGWTPLHWAAEDTQKSTFQFLFKTKTDIEAKKSVILKAPSQISKSMSYDLDKLMASMRADVRGENPSLFATRYATWEPFC